MSQTLSCDSYANPVSANWEKTCSCEHFVKRIDSIETGTYHEDERAFWSDEPVSGS